MAAPDGTARVRLPQLIAAFGVVAGAVMMVGLPFAIDPGTQRILGLAVIVIGLLATGVVPEHYTAILLFAIATLGALAPPEVIFSGFTSTAFWLVFGGLVIGVAITATGLGRRLSGLLARHFAGYGTLVGGMIGIGVLLAFLMPSAIGRSMLLMPLAVALADGVGLDRGRPGRSGLLLATAFGTNLPAFSILPANVPNLILAGAAETLYQQHVLYGRYLLLHFPVLGLVKALLLWWLVVKLFPDRLAPRVGGDAAGDWRPEERRLLVIMLGALALWLTDAWHHVSPAWIALGAATLILTPRVGAVDARLLPEKLNVSPLLFSGGALGLAALIAYSGLGALISDHALGRLPLSPGADATNYLILVGTALTTGVATTLPGVPAVLTPLAAELAGRTGFSLEVVLMTQVTGFSTVLFLYQSPPLMVALQVAGEGLGNATRLLLWLALLSLLMLVPLEFLWWRALDVL